MHAEAPPFCFYLYVYKTGADIMCIFMDLKADAKQERMRFSRRSGMLVQPCSPIAAFDLLV